MSEKLPKSEKLYLTIMIVFYVGVSLVDLHEGNVRSFIYLTFFFILAMVRPC